MGRPALRVHLGWEVRLRWAWSTVLWEGWAGKREAPPSADSSSATREEGQWQEAQPGWGGQLSTCRSAGESESCSVVSDSLWPHGLWNSPGQNTGAGSLSLLQGIFPTQGSNSGLLHCRWILYQPSHQGSPGILEWVPYPFSRGSSQLRDRTQASRIAGGFFTSWATREAGGSCESDDNREHGVHWWTEWECGRSEGALQEHREDDSSQRYEK